MPTIRFLKYGYETTERIRRNDVSPILFEIRTKIQHRYIITRILITKNSNSMYKKKIQTLHLASIIYSPVDLESWIAYSQISNQSVSASPYPIQLTDSYPCLASDKLN